MAIAPDRSSHKPIDGVTKDMLGSPAKGGLLMAEKYTPPSPDVGKPITTAAVLSPNQWEFLQRERFARGHGWNISRLIREALEAHFGRECQDEVAAPGGYDRALARKRREG